MDSGDSEKIYEKIQNLGQHDRENILLLNKEVTLFKTHFESLSNAYGNLSGIAETLITIQ